MVYFLLTLVVSMDFGLACDRPSDWHMDDLPLPAPKASWAARDEVSWRESLDDTQPAPHNPTFGDLCTGRYMGLIERWQEASDEMGLIVAMASHLEPAIM